MNLLACIGLESVSRKGLDLGNNPSDPLPGSVVLR